MRRMMLMMGGNKTYAQKMAGFWSVANFPLWEQTGTVVTDISGRSGNGVYSGVSLAVEPLMGKKFPYFDGSAGYADLKTAGLITNFNGDELTVSIWAKVYNSAVLTDGTSRCFLQLSADGNNYIYFGKTANANQYTIQRIGGGTNNYQFFTNSDAGWCNYTLTCSKSNDRVSIYCKGVLQGSVLHGLGTHVGNLVTALLGVNYIGNANKWYGYLAYVGIANRELSQTEVTQVATLNPS